MDCPRKDNHGIESFVTASRRMRRCAIHLLPAWLGRTSGDESEEVFLDGRSDTRDMFRAKHVDGSECDGEVDNANEEIYTECIPAIGFDEVFEALRERCVRWETMAELCTVL